MWDRIKISTNNHESKEQGTEERRDEEEQSARSETEDSESVELGVDIETCCGPSKCHTEANCGVHTVEAVTKALARIFPAFYCL